ncbi:hypothetical protein M501DRAFT_990210 [Patellaria atrata CBS 101060]|uniref:Uncharacterized protein n=1 Tax=Patellaria atrata CBS 101060 TaxID=1346257 RepID=A0A9P4SH77_9PEZI|nr:hypothetical protein M501DRAFT_990210 [Patellaria atrata CBS 101060]
MRESLQNEMKKRKRQKPLFKTTRLKKDGFAQIFTSQRWLLQNVKAQPQMEAARREEEAQERAAARESAVEARQAQQQLIGNIRQSRQRKKILNGVFPVPTKRVRAVAPVTQVQDSGESNLRQKRTRKAPARFIDNE